MSNDFATLAATVLGTIAKFARVMARVGLPDDFYQRIIDNAEFRNELVEFARGRHIQTSLLPAISQGEWVESLVNNQGITLDQKRTNDVLLNICFEFTRWHYAISGRFFLRLYVSASESPHGIHSNVDLALGMFNSPEEGEEQRRWEICWTRKPVNDKSQRRAKEWYVSDSLLPYDDDTLDKITDPAERWFVTHCRFVNTKYLGQDTTHSFPRLQHDAEAIEQINVMVESFKACARYSETARVANAVACPQCGRAAEFAHEGLFPGNTTKKVYRCKACIVQVWYPCDTCRESLEEEPLLFCIEKDGTASRVLPRCDS